MSVLILFVGNSHTYYNDMPVLLSRIAGANGRGPIETRRSVEPGVDLRWHWNSTKTRGRISSRPWDYVVLQERSGGPLENRDSFFKHARLLDAEIARAGAKTMFFMTWANYMRAETQQPVSEAYSEISGELDAVLVPVGQAWQNVYGKRPGLVLHAPDNRHANFLGSYLTACVFYATLLGSAPGNKNLLEGEIREYGEEDIRVLHQTAFETVRAFGS